MTKVILDLIQEGKSQGKVKSDISEEVFTIYIFAFMDIFTNPQLQQRFYNNPKSVQDLGATDEKWLDYETRIKML